MKLNAIFSLQIDHTTRTVTPDGPPVKKKHKGGNYEVSQGISSQRKVHRDANSTLVQTGLEGRLCIHLSHLMGKPTMWFPTRSDINRPVQSQKRARILKFWI